MEKRFLLSVVIVLVLALVCWAGLWACGFRQSLERSRDGDIVPIGERLIGRDVKSFEIYCPYQSYEIGGKTKMVAENSNVLILHRQQGEKVLNFRLNEWDFCSGGGIEPGRDYQLSPYTTLEFEPGNKTKIAKVNG